MLSSFLNCPLNELVYVKQPPSFKDPKFPNQILALVPMEARWSMEMAPGVNPRPDRVLEQELLTPETEFQMAAEHGGVFAIMTIRARVYASGAIYRQSGGVGGCSRQPRHRRA